MFLLRWFNKKHLLFVKDQQKYKKYPSAPCPTSFMQIVAKPKSHWTHNAPAPQRHRYLNLCLFLGNSSGPGISSVWLHSSDCGRLWFAHVKWHTLDASNHSVTMKGVRKSRFPSNYYCPSKRLSHSRCTRERCMFSPTYTKIAFYDKGFAYFRILNVVSWCPCFVNFKNV